MQTIVAKGTDYSHNNILDLQNSKVKDINLVLVYPTGVTKSFQTSKELLDNCTESASTIIY